MSRRSDPLADATLYQFWTPIQGRFQDLDPLGHVNNVAIAAYYEIARFSFFEMLREQRNDPISVLVARLDIAYLDELFLKPAMDVSSGIARLGNSSFVVGSALRQGGKVVGTCRCTMVYTDRDTKKPQPIPDAVRTAFAAYQLPVPEDV